MPWLAGNAGQKHFAPIGLYALIGSASVCAGVTRMALALSVMMMEATGACMHSYLPLDCLSGYVIHMAIILYAFQSFDPLFVFYLNPLRIYIYIYYLLRTYTFNSGNVQYGLPLVLSVLPARWVGNLYNEGIYDTTIRLRQIPFLENSPPEVAGQLKATDIMSPNPLCLTPVRVHVRASPQK